MPRRACIVAAFTAGAQTKKPISGSLRSSPGRFLFLRLALGLAACLLLLQALNEALNVIFSLFSFLFSLFSFLFSALPSRSSRLDGKENLKT
jgi:hypothetical protein